MTEYNIGDSENFNKIKIFDKMRSGDKLSMHLFRYKLDVCGCMKNGVMRYTCEDCTREWKTSLRNEPKNQHNLTKFTKYYTDKPYVMGVKSINYKPKSRRQRRAEHKKSRMYGVIQT